MTTVLGIESYRFLYYARDRDEPVHIYVEDDENIVKSWIDPVRLHGSAELRRADVNRLHKLVQENREHLLRAWNECFRD